MQPTAQRQGKLSKEYEKLLGITMALDDAAQKVPFLRTKSVTNTQEMLSKLLSDPVLHQLPESVTIDYVDDLIRIETGQVRRVL
jgi:hypothetical protein